MGIFTQVITTISATLIPALITLISVIFANIRKLNIERKYNAERVENLLKEITKLKLENHKYIQRIQELEQKLQKLTKGE